MPSALAARAASGLLWPIVPMSDKDRGTGFDVDRLLALLDDTGGGWTRIASDTVRGQRRIGARNVPILARLDPKGFVTFAIVPFLASPSEEEAASRLYERLLTLNHALVMAKFSIDDDLDVVLSVDYPVATLDRSEIVDALGALSYYAELHYESLRAIA